MDLSQYLGGLPLHPLIVHFVVVLVPLAALGLILLVLLRGWADRYGWLALLVLAVGTGATFVAKQSGDDLALQLGRPADHANWGTVLPYVSSALLVVALVWFLLHRADRRADRKRSPATVVTGLLTVVLALAATIITVVVGHSGAQAAWGSRTVPQAPTSSASVAPPPPSPTPTETSTPSGSASPTTSASASFTLAEVAKHNTATNCWAAISGSVYDLTSWISQHPGGPEHITALCGTDATSAFTAQHNGDAQAAGQLAEFKIGTLA